ncbi:hypothetical protein MP228_013022 [Amoeboaphelidium protococcarum]|nr:hypothetical protein MP228_013022 [Amoeboaphelidium protococcarum]
MTCTWSPNTTTEKDPHRHQVVECANSKKAQVCDTILDHIGNTPLVKLNKIPQSEGVQCQVYAKCDFFNAGGSVKDRIAKRMVEEAEREGRLKPGYTIIEPTSGNTGIGLALCAAVKGYRAIITMPEKMSQEKVDVLKALGAEIVRTPTEAAFDSPESHISVAQKLNKEIPNSVILDQYSNPYNPLAHYDGTAEEILAACGGKIDMFICGAGTGGTIAGIGRKLREKCPKCIVVGVDPHGSILALPESLNSSVASYKVEGIGYDFIPRVLDRSVVDKWYKSNDKDSFAYSRRLIREEGILCGGSSGSAMDGAMRAIKEYGRAGDKDFVAVVLFADSVRNYMSKFLNDTWMANNKFINMESASSYIEEPLSPLTKETMFQFGPAKIKDLNLPLAVCVNSSTSCQEAAKIMKTKNFDQVPVIDSKDGKVLGLVTLGNILSKVSHGRATLGDAVSQVMYRVDKSNGFVPVTPETPLVDMIKFFDKHSSAIVTEDASGNGAVKHIVTKFDLVSFMISPNV